MSQDKVNVITDCRIIGDLLCAFLRKACDVQCARYESVESLPPPPEGSQSIALLDCHNRDRAFVVNSIARVKRVSTPSHLIALFDLKSNLDVENVAISNGVRGFIYSTDSSDVLKKALNSILKGEVWISRCKLTEFLTQPHMSLKQDEENPRQILTSREKQILSLLVNGTTNEDIACELNISPHTVKSHFFNIFKKIEVPNRVKAAIWAARHSKELGS